MVFSFWVSLNSSSWRLTMTMLNLLVTRVDEWLNHAHAISSPGAPETSWNTRIQCLL